MKNEVIICNNISLSIKNKKILKNINFSIFQGEIIALIGPNGAGKNTLLKAVSGLLKTDIGEILIFNKNIYRSYIPEIKAFIEIPSAFDYFTGEEFLKYFTALNNKEFSVEKIFEFFSQEELELLKKKKISEYSHGKKQKVFLTAIFLCEPQILLLDEPTIALDVSTLRLLTQKILELKEKGCTIIISSHDFHFVNTLCERILFIKDGEIVSDIRQPEILDKIDLSSRIFQYLLTIKDDLSIEKAKEIMGKALKKINDNVYMIECTFLQLQEILKQLVEKQVRILEIKYYKDPTEIFFEKFLQ